MAFGQVEPNLYVVRIFGGDRGVDSTARRKIGSALFAMVLGKQYIAEIRQCPGQLSAVFGVIGEILGQSLHQRQLAAKLFRRPSESPRRFRDQTQAVAAFASDWR